jgi:hypothetical protein
MVEDVEVPATCFAIVHPEGVVGRVATALTDTQQISKLPNVRFSLAPHAGVTAALAAPCDAAPIVPTSEIAITSHHTFLEQRKKEPEPHISARFRLLSSQRSLPILYYSSSIVLPEY